MRKTDDNQVNIHDSNRNFKIGGNDVDSAPRYSVGRRDLSNLSLGSPAERFNVLCHVARGTERSDVASSTDPRTGEPLPVRVTGNVIDSEITDKRVELCFVGSPSQFHPP